MDFSNLLKILMQNLPGSPPAQIQTPVDWTPYRNSLLAWTKNMPRFNSPDWNNQFQTWYKSKPSLQDYFPDNTTNSSANNSNPFLTALKGLGR